MSASRTGFELISGSLTSAGRFRETSSERGEAGSGPPEYVGESVENIVGVRSRERRGESPTFTWCSATRS